MREFVIGSRGSALALWQTHHVASLMRSHHPQIDIRIEIIHTKGDKILDVALSRIGDRALFTKELEVALMEGSIDMAVHSLKDLPTMLPDGLTIGAIGERHEPNDALVAEQGMTIDSLPHGATVATSSLRRRAQLLALRPDLDIVDVRGNVQTRLDRRRENGWEGMILALPGLARLNLMHEIAQVIPVDVMIPAVGQGALAIEVRGDDEEMLAKLATIEHEATRIAVTAERALLRSLEGGCQVPIGAYAKFDGAMLTMDAIVASIDGTATIRRSMASETKDAERLGTRLAQALVDAGAGELLSLSRANQSDKERQ